MSDIDLAGRQWVPLRGNAIAAYREAYTGTINGNGYYIDNLTCNQVTIPNAGDKTGAGAARCRGWWASLRRHHPQPVHAQRFPLSAHARRQHPGASRHFRRPDRGR